MIDNDEKYAMGFNYFDQMKYMFRMMAVLFMIFEAVIVLLFLVLFFFSFNVGFLLFIPYSAAGLALVFAVIMAPILIFAASMQYLTVKKISRNYVKFKRTRLKIVKQIAPNTPRFTLEIPYTLIDRAMKVDKDIVRKWKKRSKWFHRLSMRYTLAHGHMYNVGSGTDNLVIIYLRKKMDLRNYDLAHPLKRYPSVRKRKISEVVIDIEKERQEEFLKRLDEEIVKGRVRMIEMRKGKIKKQPRIAKPPPR
jgi:predicted membrane protein